MARGTTLCVGELALQAPGQADQRGILYDDPGQRQLRAVIVRASHNRVDGALNVVPRCVLWHAALPNMPPRRDWRPIRPSFFVPLTDQSRHYFRSSDFSIVQQQTSIADFPNGCGEWRSAASALLTADFGDRRRPSAGELQATRPAGQGMSWPVSQGGRAKHGICCNFPVRRVWYAATSRLDGVLQRIVRCKTPHEPRLGVRCRARL